MSTLFLLAWMAQEAPPQGEAEVQETSEAVESMASTAPDAGEPVADVAVEESDTVVVVERAPPRAPDFSMEGKETGASLYSASENRWNRHQVGSLVTVNVEDWATTTVKADTVTDQTSNSDSRVGALLGITTKIKGANPNLIELDDAEIGVSGGSRTDFRGNGTTSRENTFQASLTCTVVEVLPNGNLRIEGHKTITVNGETQYLVVAGVVRPMDVKGDNTVESKFLANPIIQMSGDGAVDDKQHPGVVNRKLGWLWPF
ncbi:MAG: flagellar L-ring protein precursor FlgH [Cognaticolwellia sp.]|jgi:flagellar L-ring protein precursor FlgH